MPDFVLSRFLTVGCLVTVFAVMTVLAHRTKVHAHWIRVIGLGVSCALLASAWWINTTSFEMAAFPAQAFSIILFVALGVFYAAAVMRSQSVVRWAGALAACLLAVIGLVMDAILASHTTDVAFSFAICLLSVNFLGHLLRARVNQALLRAPKAAADNSASQSLCSLLTQHPDWAQNQDFCKTVAGVLCLKTQVLTILRALLPHCTIRDSKESTQTIARPVPASVIFSVAKLCQIITAEIRSEGDIQVVVSIDAAGIHITLEAPNTHNIRSESLKGLSNLDIDALQTHVDDQSVNIAFGYRF